MSSLVQSSSQLSQQSPVPQRRRAARAKACWRSTADLLQLTGGVRHFTLAHTVWIRARVRQPAYQAYEVVKGLDCCTSCSYDARVEWNINFAITCSSTHKSRSKQPRYKAHAANTAGKSSALLSDKGTSQATVKRSVEVLCCAALCYAVPPPGAPQQGMVPMMAPPGDTSPGLSVFVRAAVSSRLGVGHFLGTPVHQQ